MTHPPVRTLAHPGPPDSFRLRARSAPAARHARLLLQPGLNLHDALVRPLAAAGIHHAAMTLGAGRFRAVRYCTGGPDPSGRTAACYAAPRDAGPVLLLSGHATLGTGLGGHPLVHCHAAFADTAGTLRGGHLLTPECWVADAPIPVRVTALDGIELRQGHDEETNMPLFLPYPAAAYG